VINRTGPQCKDKWHRLTLAFSKIKNWESFRPPGKKSFWKMKVEERHAEGLGFRLDEHTFAALNAMGSSAVAPALVLDEKSGISSITISGKKNAGSCKLNSYIVYAMLWILCVSFISFFPFGF
jgi:hypothetical protein